MIQMRTISISILLSQVPVWVLTAIIMLWK